ncbi:MAG: NAD(P)/FAD-dependent oxidoreductase [Chloroflexota bacterium]
MQDIADITIIGAGVVGLAVAAKVADKNRQVYVLERHATSGQETSSRHSGIIHAGIYYPENSLKAKLCVTGSRLLYRLCQQSSIGCRKPGKLIVATSKEEADELEALMERGNKNGAPGLKMLSKKILKQLEPNIEGVAAILSPETGIIDSHALIKYFAARARSEQVQIAYLTEVVGIETAAGGYKVEVKDSEGGFSFITRVIVNCAGLGSDKVAELAGIDIDDAGYRLHYCKGEYFSITDGKREMVSRLIFPVPPVGVTGVGIHVVIDLDGRMRLGPSIHYVDEIDYGVTNEHKQLFYDSVKGFLPFIDYDDLQPEMSGIRPKLQGPDEDIRDFVIRDEGDRGLPGFINLIGIESPGLTAAPAIAEYVEDLVSEALSGL